MNHKDNFAQYDTCGGYARKTRTLFLICACVSVFIWQGSNVVLFAQQQQQPQPTASPRPAASPQNNQPAAPTTPNTPTTPSTAVTPTAPAVNTPPAKPADVQSLDSLIAALYDVISGPAGQKRDWDRMRSLFLPQGHLAVVVPRRGEPNSFAARFITVEEYIQRSGPQLETNGFFERELARTVEQYGNIAHVFSTYDSRHKKDDAKPFARGINSIQAVYDGKRWWVLSVLWDSERPGNELPAKYLPKG